MSAVSVLVGRARELEVIADAVADARRGRGAVVVLEGEAGIGKTRLVDAALAAAPWLAVRRGAAEELEQGRPFGSLAEALAFDPAALVDLASTETFVVVDLSQRVVDAAIASLETVTLDGPVALVIEDLHWGDASTLRALRAITRRLQHLPLAVLLSMRPTPRAPELDRLVGALLAEGARHIVLEPLAEEEAKRLAAVALDAEPGPNLLRQISGAAGNPLFVIELLTALRAEGAIEFAAGRAESHALPLPPTLRLTILRRFSFLSRPTLDLLRSAAILGSSFTVHDLSAVTGRSAIDIAPALEEAVRAKLLEDAGDRLVFRHDLFRESLYGDIPVAVRSAMHGDTARALEQIGAAIDRVAEHVALGASPGDEEAVRTLRGAALSVVFASPPSAVRLLERALELAPPASAERDRVIAELVMPLELVGRAADAHAQANEILDRGVPADVEYVLRRSLGYSLLVEGRPRESLRHYEIATKHLGGREFGGRAEEDHALDLANQGIARLLLGDIGGARRDAELALSIAEEARVSFGICMALFALGPIADAAGDVADHVQIRRRAFELAQRDPTARGGNMWMHIGSGQALATVDQLGEAERILREGLALVRDQGRGSHLPLYHALLALVRFHSGSWDEAWADAEAGIDAAAESGGLALNLLFAVGASIALHRGDTARATTLLGEGELALARSPTQIGADLFIAAKAYSLESAGGSDQALSLLELMWERMAPLRYQFGAWRHYAPHLVRLLVATGRPDDASEVAAIAEEGARRAPGVASAAGAALRCRGLATSSPEMLMAAVEVLRSSPYPLDRARSCEDAATLTVSLDRSSAEALVDEALGIYEQLGAEHDLTRLLSAARTAGIRRSRRTTRGRPRSGWESLTDAESRVVDLVAEGLTNSEVATRLFVSRYTVETHLKHVFAKLGVASRTELAAARAKRAHRSPSGPPGSPDT